MFQRIFSSWTSQNLDDEDLSPEDAQLIKTLLQFKTEFNKQSSVVMSQEGLKNIGQIYYHNKFKNILWTNNMNDELPIKCSDCPLPSELNKMLSDKTFDA